MKQPKFIKRIIQKHEEKEFNKPKHDIEALYVGEIVFIVDEKYVNYSTTSYTYRPIKKFAIFKKADDYLVSLSYIHPSNQKLKIIGLANVNDYAIKDLRPFKNAFILSIREGKIPQKVSKSFIVKLETGLNKKLAPNQKENHLFDL